VLSGRGLCDGLVTRPEGSYRLWRVVVCDKETSNNEEAKARYRAVENTTTLGCKAKKTNKKHYRWYVNECEYRALVEDPDRWKLQS